MTVSHVRMPLGSQLCCFQSSFVLMHMGRLQEMVQVWVPAMQRVDAGRAPVASTAINVVGIHAVRELSQQMDALPLHTPWLSFK